MNKLECTGYPSNLQDRFMIRLPDGIRDQVRTMAEKNLRSMNAEFVILIKDALSRVKS